MQFSSKKKTLSIKKLFIILIALFLISTLPSFSLFFTSQEEYELGKEAAKEYEQKYGLCESPSLKRQLNSVSKELTKVAPNTKEVNYIFKVSCDEEPNAVSFPGGFIYITSGLYKIPDFDDNQLACILGHEMMHIIKRHSMKRLERDLGVNIIIQLALGKKENIKKLTSLSKDLLILKYSREQELEADRGGMLLAYKAGYNPAGLIIFFQTLMKLEKSNSPHASYIIANHPHLETRIEKAKEVLAEIQKDSLH